MCQEIQDVLTQRNVGAVISRQYRIGYLGAILYSTTIQNTKEAEGITLGIISAPKSHHICECKLMK